MGLDMYLSKKTYVKNWDHNPKYQHYDIKILKGGLPTDIKPERISYIIEQVAYWRKFNALHSWFVANVQDGVDECREEYVSIEKLKELLTTLKKVATNPTEAKNELPTQPGFFFGGTDYDYYYFDMVKETISTLEEILKETGGDFYYRASW